MPKPKAPLQFDPREIALVFSLFVFVCLLMFTIGILVGKGLSSRQPTSEVTELEAPEHGAEKAHDAHSEGKSEHKATHEPTHEPDVKSGHSEKTTPEEKKHEPKSEHAATPSHEGGRSHEDGHGEKTEHAEASHKETKKSAHTEAPEREVASTKPEEIELIPLAPQKSDWSGTSLKNGKKTNKDTELLLANPKILALTEKFNQPSMLSIFKNKKKNAEKKSSGSGSIYGESNGPYTVQVGSYPNPKDAEERVKFLKSQGFAHAYFSAKDLGDSTGKWYRVWLGFYPDHETAQSSGNKLQNEGEVRNYLVRKADPENGIN